jgi:hypothetical protein
MADGEAGLAGTRFVTIFMHAREKITEGHIQPSMLDSAVRLAPDEKSPWALSEMDSWECGRTLLANSSA